MKFLLIKEPREFWNRGKMLIRIFAIGILFFLLIFPACKRRSEEKEAVEERVVVPAPGDYPTDLGEQDKKRAPVGTEAAADIGEFEELTPEIFVKITILYREENKKWLLKSRSLPPEEQGKYIEDANAAFFQASGITEEEYIHYSQNNMDELNEYMSEHPELLPKVMEY